MGSYIVVDVLIYVWRVVGIVGMARIVYMAGIAKVPCAPPGTLESLDVVPYAPSTFDDDTYPKDCPICMEPFSDAGVIRRTPCNHVYHEGCLQKWLQRAAFCPLCRARCDEAKPGPDEDGSGVARL